MARQRTPKDHSKYLAMKQDDLESVVREIDAEIEALREEKRVAQLGISRRVEEGAAAARVAEMTEGERLAMRRALEG